MPFAARICWCALMGAALVCGQSPPRESDPVAAARSEYQEAEYLYAEGAAPRRRVEEARRSLEIAESEAVLARTLFRNRLIEEVTEEECVEMVAAAERILAARQEELARKKVLVEEGVLARLALTPLIEELDRSRRTLDLARARAESVRALAAMARAEEAVVEAPRTQEWAPLMEKFEGSGRFSLARMSAIAAAFEAEFAKPLPVSAVGQTAVHTSLGFDHRERVDVAVNPDQPEGVWLRRHLQELGIPYYAFRVAIPGKATAPHIHIGPASERLRLPVAAGSR